MRDEQLVLPGFGLRPQDEWALEVRVTLWAMGTVVTVKRFEDGELAGHAGP